MLDVNVLHVSVYEIYLLVLIDWVSTALLLY